MYYRLAALPVSGVMVDEVIVEDLAGQRYLLDRRRAELQALSPADLTSLGTFFESSQDCIWHTITDLYRTLCDAVDIIDVGRMRIAPQGLAYGAMVPTHGTEEYSVDGW